MNFTFMPEIQRPYGYPNVLTDMGVPPDEFMATIDEALGVLDG